MLKLGCNQTFFLTSVEFYPFYTPVWKTDVLCHGNVRPSVRPSVHPLVHGLFVSWCATGWRFVINSRANIYITIDCSTALPLVLGVVTRQKPHINGSVVLGADESSRPCGTPSWYTPPSRMILSKQKNLHLFSSQYICVFSKTSEFSRIFFNMLWDFIFKLNINIQ